MTPEKLTVDPFLGPAAPALGWVPAPRYLLRRQRVLKQLRDLHPDEVLEIGPGAGMLLREMAARGYACTALETSSRARMLINALDEASGRVFTLEGAPQSDWEGRFSLVMAFEVLEHIEDDYAALSQWAQWLSPGGTLLLSVPAHQSRWNARDVWAGHVRRYERSRLLGAFGQAGLSIRHIECYGFPLANVLELAGERRYRRKGRTAMTETSSRDASTANSGVDRDADAMWFPLLRSAAGKLALRTAFALQSASSRLPLGNGWLVRAVRSQ